MHWVGEATTQSRILIHGAGSGVGTSAIQLAVDNGNAVFATAGTSAKTEMALNLGADKVVNYKTSNFADEFKSDDINLILDCVGGSFWKNNVKVNHRFNKKHSLVLNRISNTRDLDISIIF